MNGIFQRNENIFQKRYNSPYKTARAASPMDSINHRISILVKKVGSQTKFAKLVGMPKSTLNMIVGTAQVEPETRTINKILEAMPNVNREWLHSGSGPMLKVNTDTVLFSQDSPAKGAIPEEEFQDDVIAKILKPLQEEIETIKKKKQEAAEGHKEKMSGFDEQIEKINAIIRRVLKGL